MPPTDELIRVENITKTYHLGEVDVPVLKGVSFTIRRGEMVALMGASGSGKSTLMNILGCLDRPTSGRYSLDGQEISNLSSDQRALVRTAKLGFVFQSFNLLPRTTAVNNVVMPLDYSSTAPSPGEADHRAVEILTRVGLGERLDHVPSQMSGGQQQRVAIARSLINRPALLLGDEPTGNLDSKTSVEILQMFQQLNETGLTVILVTHDPKVASYVHRVIRVVDGLIEEDTAGGRAHVSPYAGIAATSPSQNGTSAAPDSDPELPATESDGGGVAVAAPPKVRVSTTAVAATPTVKTAAAPAPAPSHKWSLAAALIPSPLRTAVNALRRNKMRSALTTLGIIIGVGAVIAMVEISQGSRNALMKTMTSMGANNLSVRSSDARSGGISMGSGSSKTLTPDDAVEIGRQCPSVSAVAPTVRTRAQVIRGGKNWVPDQLIGTAPGYLVVRDWSQLDDGTMFTERDVAGSARVCVIGQTVARELFGRESPVGQDLRVKNVTLKVVGVLSAKGANMIGMDQDDVLMAPWTTVKYRISGDTGNATTVAAPAASGTTTTNSLSNLYPTAKPLYPEQSAAQQMNTPKPVKFVNIDQIDVKAASAESIPKAISEIEALLRERHNIREEDESDFYIRDMSEFQKALGSTSELMGGLLMIVAMISLAVGGVGIMNIMLVSVTERTREIGLRMAVGARGFHILRQFLIESIVLCLFGGIVGIMLGRIASTIVWYFLRWPIEPSLFAIIGACAVSAAVGIGFGFYPAWKASRLDPIEALRYE
ncbi:ABC transporter permease [Planctomyces sp. SH-PL14]|uniref:ABC transporter permease n=1 Tax=Planctomyces sp. SH-PL14 TaxID=1632864 RepID=UPI00078D6803|nr:ABC transporter permease [Planctomyces sp. SH-PL14]AMV17641.1 Macrolide export ATP-binding/permease protein MacB [Planctomyces sp. SH-PL14]